MPPKKERVIKEKKEKKVKEKKEVALPFEQRPLVIKVSQKKAVSIYNINRFPVTLYAEQWTRLLNHSDEIRRFIENNREELATKETSKLDNNNDNEEEILIPIN